MAVKTAISHCLVLRWHPRVRAVTGSCPARYLARRGGTRLLTVQVSAWLSSVLRIVVRYANNPRYVPEGLFRQRIPMRPVGEAPPASRHWSSEETTWALRERAISRCPDGRYPGGRYWQVWVRVPWRPARVAC